MMNNSIFPTSSPRFLNEQQIVVDNVHLNAYRVFDSRYNRTVIVEFLANAEDRNIIKHDCVADVLEEYEYSGGRFVVSENVNAGVNIMWNTNRVITSAVTSLYAEINNFLKSHNFSLATNAFEEGLEVFTNGYEISSFKLGRPWIRRIAKPKKIKTALQSQQEQSLPVTASASEKEAEFDVDVTQESDGFRDDGSKSSEESDIEIINDYCNITDDSDYYVDTTLSSKFSESSISDNEWDIVSKAIDTTDEATNPDEAEANSVHSDNLEEDAPPQNNEYNDSLTDNEYVDAKESFSNDDDTVDDIESGNKDSSVVEYAECEYFASPKKNSEEVNAEIEVWTSETQNSDDYIHKQDAAEPRTNYEWPSESEHSYTDDANAQVVNENTDSSVVESAKYDYFDSPKKNSDELSIEIPDSLSSAAFQSMPVTWDYDNYDDCNFKPYNKEICPDEKLIFSILRRENMNGIYEVLRQRFSHAHFAFGFIIPYLRQVINIQQRSQHRNVRVNQILLGGEEDIRCLHTCPVENLTRLTGTFVFTMCDEIQEVWHFPVFGDRVVYKDYNMISNNVLADLNFIASTIANEALFIPLVKITNAFGIQDLSVTALSSGDVYFVLGDQELMMAREGEIVVSHETSLLSEETVRAMLPAVQVMLENREKQSLTVTFQM